MKFHSLRSLLTAVTALGAALLLGSCGGGGAGGNPGPGGALILQPAGENQVIYAGMPTTFQIGGGRPPYQVTSGDQGILPMPFVVHGNSFTVIPNNPGVIDAGLQPGELPRRTISVDLRDSTGIFLRSVVAVAQNFLTGYGVSITPTTCPDTASGGADPPAQLCAGGESALQMQATFNGSLAGNRQFRLEVIRGGFALRHPVTGQVSNSIVVNSDHSGTVMAIVQASAGTPTGLAVFRVVDVATGVYADHVFTIGGISQSQNITPIPNDFTFTGPLTTVCGTGTADFIVFDGVPPYTAVSVNPNIEVTPSVSNSQPGRFTIRATNPNVCVTDATIVITDSRGGRGTVTVTTEPGDTEPEAPPALSAGPTTVTLGCGQSGSVAVVGGTGNYFAVSSNPNVTTAVSGNILTITRVGTPNTVGVGTQAVSVAVSDGRAIVTITANVPATCP